MDKSVSGIDEQEKKFEEGLNSKVKLSLYRTRLVFKFKSETHGLMRIWVDIEEGRGERVSIV